MLATDRGPGRKAGRILLMSVTLSFLCCSIGFAASGLDSRPTNTACVALARPAGTLYQLTRVFSPMVFNRPVGVQQSPNNGQRWYVIEQSGRVMTFLDGDQQASVFVDVAQKITTAGGEQGLLGMAFHPSYPSVPYVYLSYTALDGRSVISRFTKSGAGDFLEPSTEIMILQQSQPYANHNGGEIAFGHDGYLYIGLGDGGSGGDPLNNGQNTHTLLGAMLRIDVNAGSPYAIPSGNPFASSTGCGNGQGCPEIYAWGFRNPWRFSFDSSLGDLWVGDVGQALWEEVDLVRVGRNYGWRCYEGTHAYNLTGCDPLASYEPPVIEYAHSDGNCSVIGGYVYRGTALPELGGIYIFGDYCSGRVWALTNNGGVNTATVLVDSTFLITSFGQGNNGEIYLTERGGGVYVMEKAPPLVSDPFPNTLSQTGYVDLNNATQPASCFIPYTVNSELWSDGAGKRRWLAIPDGAFMHVEKDGDFTFPVGSVLMKEFSLNGKRIETRAFMRHQDGGWAGYTFEWNDTETEAVLLDAAKTKLVGAQTWYFPSRNDCQRCHSSAAGNTLGLEIAQLNGPITYPTTGRTSNQLETLDFIGMFDVPLGAPPTALTKLPDPLASSASIGPRAKSYLHANCSNCHRPSGPARGSIDFLYPTPLVEMGICSVNPELGNLSITGAQILYLGDPSRSILSVRMKRLDEFRMPPLASNLVDVAGTAVIDEWINGLTVCRPFTPLWYLPLLSN